MLTAREAAADELREIGDALSDIRERTRRLSHVDVVTPVQRAWLRWIGNDADGLGCRARKLAEEIDQ